MAFTSTFVTFALLILSAHGWITLQDVSLSAGMVYSMGPKTKYGGPSIADLDGDGYQDMLFTHHDSYAIEIYFNMGNGTFSQQVGLFSDTHALSPFRYSPTDRAMYFSLSQGGAFGSKPAPMAMFKVSSDRTITNVSPQAGITESTRGRGRSALYMSLRPTIRKATTDVLVLNGPNPRFTLRHQQGLTAVGDGKFESRNLVGFDTEGNWYGALTDIDGKGNMEVLSYQHLRAYGLTGYFELTDFTSLVFPDGFKGRGTVAVAELDFDNDGWWDLYVCRTRTADLKWLPDNVQNTDYLLRNVGGKYIDVTNESGIPQDGMSRGVTVGDFDNDGHIDILVVKFEGPNLFLRNLGNGTFVVEYDVPTRLFGAPGDMAQAVDYDRDGALDIVMSEGHTHDLWLGGYYRLFKNLLSVDASANNYLLIRVGSSPELLASSLHAVVTVFAGELQMVRRVGPTGVAVSASNIELLHFGLGNRTVDRVDVRWRDSATETYHFVDANSMITVGIFF